MAEGFVMKKLVLAFTAVAAFTGSALAADLPARTYTKAPMMPEPVMNWTGFYIFGGIGGGVWDADQNVVNGAGNGITINQRPGGDGWLGTVGAGYDWQFNSSWVAGIFADGQFGSLRGNIPDAFTTCKAPRSFATLGLPVCGSATSLLRTSIRTSTPVHRVSWSGASLGPVTGTAPTVNTPSFNLNGWFVGGGVENNLNIFGITAPGWFMKTEYRAAYFSKATLGET